MEFSKCSSVISLSILFHKFLLKMVTPPDDGWWFNQEPAHSQHPFSISLLSTFSFVFPCHFIFSFSSFKFQENCFLSFMDSTKMQWLVRNTQKRLELGCCCCCCCHFAISGLFCILYHMFSYGSFLVLHLDWLYNIQLYKTNCHMDSQIMKVYQICIIFQLWPLWCLSICCVTYHNVPTTSFHLCWFGMHKTCFKRMHHLITFAMDLFVWHVIVHSLCRCQISYTSDCK